MNARDRYNYARIECDSANREYNRLIVLVEQAEMRVKHAEKDLTEAYDEFLRSKPEYTMGVEGEML